VLWSIAAAFAAFTVLTSLFPSLISPGPNGIITTVLLVAFALLHGSERYGNKGIAIFVVVCLVVSNIFENLSIVTGFPFGHYHYSEVLGTKLFLVPMTIGGAYFGAGYLSWTVSLILLGRTNKPIDTFGRWALPTVASFLMASWDFMLDPSASTVDHEWIWQNGGGFFGVPFQNYLGWLLTVFVFFAIFSGYVASRRLTDASAANPFSRGFWAQSIVMYALLGVRNFLTYFVPSANTRVLDATGHVWMLHDIRETAALVAIFTIFTFSILAALRLADSGQTQP
jgi:putative membrane protein